MLLAFENTPVEVVFGTLLAIEQVLEEVTSERSAATVVAEAVEASRPMLGAVFDEASVMKISGLLKG